MKDQENEALNMLHQSTAVIFSKNNLQLLSKPKEEFYETVRFEHCKDELSSLRQHLLDGKSITCAIYKGNKRKTSCFASQQVFGVDFDNTFSLAEVDGVLADYGINYNFGYYTFNHLEEAPRFRIFFVMDGEVRDVNLAKDINKAFYEIFDRKSDDNALDVARIWLGTNKGSFDGDLYRTVNPEQIIKLADQKIFSRDRNQTRSLLLQHKSIEKCAKENNSIIYNYRKRQICTHSSNENNEGLKIITNYKLEDLFELEIFKVFYEGGGTPTKGNKLVHGELLGLASNLAPIKGGEKLYKECIDKNKHYSKDKRDILSYVKRQADRYKPLKFSSFSPFQEDIENQYQTLPQLLQKRGKIKIIDTSLKVDYIMLEEGRKRLNDAYDTVMACKEDKIYLIKAAPGLGKTELFKNTSGIVMAFPDHDLKEEQFSSSKLPEHKKMLTPDVPNFNPKIQKKIGLMYAVGKNQDVTNLVKSISEEDGSASGGLEVTQNDISVAKKYLHDIESAKSSDNDVTIFTTHTRAIFTEYERGVLVFDEDPLKCIIDVNRVSKDDLKRFYDAEGSANTKLLSLLNDNDDNVMKKTPDFGWDKNHIMNTALSIKFQTKIFKFFESKSYIKDGDYIQYSISHLAKLPKNKTIVITDATASEELYRSFFGERLEVIDISNVKNTGIIIQDVSRSCSRTGLKMYGEDISAKVGNDLCITFKGFKDYFKNSSEEMHFGKVRGSNNLEGVSFSVVGIPHHNNFYYRFLADACDIKIDSFEMIYIRVTYKNREFSIQTFEDVRLQKIHLELVEGELIQAVHRARLIEHDITVNLYSNLPLDQATYINPPHQRNHCKAL